MVERRGEEEALYSLNNYNKRRTKLRFLRNCLWLAKTFVEHLRSFENDFPSARLELLEFGERAPRDGAILDLDALAERKELSRESAREFVLEFATEHEKILDTRKNLQKFTFLSSQTGQDFLHKGGRVWPEKPTEARRR